MYTLEHYTVTKMNKVTASMDIGDCRGIVLKKESVALAGLAQ